MISNISNYRDLQDLIDNVYKNIENIGINDKIKQIIICMNKKDILLLNA